MAHEEISYEIEPVSHDIGLNGLTYSLAGLAGLGIVLMIVALGVGVIEPDAHSEAIAILFIGGLCAFIIGGIAWVGVVQPQANFDDINQPLNAAPHHHEADAAEDHSHSAH